MAETVAAIGLAASIISLVKFGSKLVSRIKELQQSTGEVPVVLKDVAVQLPLLLDLTQRLQIWAVNNASINPDVELSLNRTITGCMRQITEIDEHIQAWHAPAKSSLRQFYKAISSLHAEKKVMGKLRILETYKTTLQVFCTNAVLPLASTQSARQTFFNFPYSQVSRFVGRQRVLSELTNYLEEDPSIQSQCKIAVLHGMGGQGKTQIALEYCRRASHSGAFGFVCWMDASSETALIRSFGTATEKLTKKSIAFPNDESRVSYLRDFLSRSSDKWVLVFDNFDRPDNFGDITTYFPPWHNGVLVITTRHTGVERLGKGIAVDGMAQDEAVELFLGRCRLDATKENQVQAAAVVRSLGHLPLAIDQAGSYICSRKIPLESFQEHYDCRKEVILKHTPTLWDYRKKIADDEITSSLTTFTTWEMSLQQIPQEDGAESIVHFLTLSAFLDSRDIGQSLFSAYSTSLPQHVSWTSMFLTQNQWDEFKFQDLLALLRGLSLIQDIQFKNREAHFSLHPLVKEWLRLRSPSADIPKYDLEAMQVVCASIGSSHEREMDFEVRSSLVAHVDACMIYQNQTLKGISCLSPPLLEEFASSFASLYNSHGRYNDAEALYARLLKFQERGEDSSRWQTAMNLANTLRNLGRYDLAMEVTEKVFEERKECLGLNHLDTLRALEGLALTHCLQEKYDHASQEYEHILRERERQLGISDLETVRALQCVANCLRHKRQYSEAEALYGWAMQIRARVEKHPGLCAHCSMEGLAIVYRHQERLDEAIHLYELVLQYFRTTFGTRHPRFLQTTLNLSIAYIHAKKIGAAEYMAKRAFEGFCDLFGPDHPDTKRAGEQVAETQIAKTRIQYTLRGPVQQSYLLELTEFRKSASQLELSSLERSTIQEKFFEDAKSTTRPDAFQISKGGEYKYTSASNSQIYDDSNGTKDQGLSHESLSKKLIRGETKDADSSGSLDICDAETVNELPLKDEEAGERVRSASSEEDIHFQLERNSFERSTKNIVDLFAACGADYGAFVEFLLAHCQLGPDAKDYTGDTQLSRAAKNGHVNMVNYLLSRNDVAADSTNRRHCTPLLHACRSGHAEVIRPFLRRKDISIRTWNSALTYTASSNQAESFKMLLTVEHLDINAFDNFGRSSLSWWIDHENEELVRILLDMGANPKDTSFVKTNNPLFRALKGGNLNIVKMIVEKNIANPKAINDAFAEAAAWADVKVLRLLLDTGVVEINHKYANSITPMLAAAAASSGSAATVALLLEKGADLSIPNEKGQTPLHLACEHGDPDTVQLLLDHSTVQVDVVDDRGHGPLHYAIEGWHMEIVQQLLKVGAKIDPGIDTERLDTSKPERVTERSREEFLDLLREAIRERQE